MEANTTCLVWNGARKCYFLGGRPLPTIAFLSAARFYPHYNFLAASCIPEHIEVSPRHQEAVDLAISRRENGMGRIGFDVNYRIDRETTELVDAMRMMTRQAQDTLIRQVIGTQRSTLCPQTRALWRYLHHRQWHPIATHVPATTTTACTHLRFAGRIKLICWDAAHTAYILVDPRFGFAESLYAATEHALTFPLHHGTDCPRNQHWIQIAIQRACFQTTTPLPVHATVLYLDSGEDPFHSPTRITMSPLPTTWHTAPWTTWLEPSPWFRLPKVVLRTKRNRGHQHFIERTAHFTRNTERARINNIRKRPRIDRDTYQGSH